jgi:uncharacterized membrane protein
MNRNLFANKEGFVLVSVVCITLIISIAIIGLVGMLSVARIADAVAPFLGHDVRAANLVAQCRTSLVVGVVLSIVMVLVFWAVSAQRRETQESPQQYFPR